MTRAREHSCPRQSSLPYGIGADIADDIAADNAADIAAETIN